MIKLEDDHDHDHDDGDKAFEASTKSSSSGSINKRRKGDTADPIPKQHQNGSWYWFLPEDGNHSIIESEYRHLDFIPDGSNVDNDNDEDDEDYNNWECFPSLFVPSNEENNEETNEETNDDHHETPPLQPSSTTTTTTTTSTTGKRKQPPQKTTRSSSKRRVAWSNDENTLANAIQEIKDPRLKKFLSVCLIQYNSGELFTGATRSARHPVGAALPSPPVGAATTVPTASTKTPTATTTTTPTRPLLTNYKSVKNNDFLPLDDECFRSITYRGGTKDGIRKTAVASRNLNRDVIEFEFTIGNRTIDDDESPAVTAASKDKGSSTSTATFARIDRKSNSIPSKRCTPSTSTTINTTTTGNWKHKHKQTLQDRWMETYQRLKAYKKKHKTTRVPVKYKVDPKLGLWVRTQRNDCKGKERVDLLNDIGFEWQILETNDWGAMYQRLLTYKEKHGTTRVPKRYQADPKLANWVQRQRQTCKEQDRIDRLNDIGFIWRMKGIEIQEEMRMRAVRSYNQWAE